MTTWLVTGAAGQLGTHLVDLLQLAGDDVRGVTRSDLDITSRRDVDDVITIIRPDVVINAAAYTAVDAAESDETDAMLVNGTAPGLLATALARTGRGRLVHVSTDYVFDGRASTPYEPGDQVGPRSAYGRSKLAGERAVLAALPDRSHVVRAAWVYGGPGPNFVDTMCRLEAEREYVDVVTDQTGSPTWVRDLAAALIALGRSQDAPPLLHFANTGQASWNDLAREVFRLVGADPDRVRPSTSDAFVRPAPRPAWSVLSTMTWTQAGLPRPAPWRDALSRCFATRRPPR